MRSITFLTHRFDITVGAVYTISELARHLAAHFKVALIVQAGAPEPIPGIDVRVSPMLNESDFPDADVLVSTSGFLDHDRLFALPRSKGLKAIYLQGWHGERTLRNITRADIVLAVSSWLVAAAAEAAVRARFVRYGFDHDVFHDRGLSPRAPRLVSMATDKALDVGMQALDIVRSSRADVAIQLFGRQLPPDPALPFLHRPGRTEIADLWRRTTVAVCPSALEGFGFLGLEAIAGGAALATTDTRGSREYAFHGDTALVSPPGDASALAANILRLLDDEGLRHKLVTAGQQHLKQSFDEWPYASRVFAETLADEIQRTRTLHP